MKLFTVLGGFLDSRTEYKRNETIRDFFGLSGLLLIRLLISPSLVPDLELSEDQGARKLHKHWAGCL